MDSSSVMGSSCDTQGMPPVVGQRASLFRTSDVCQRSEVANSTSCGEVPEWLKGADCKSAGSGLRGFEPHPHHHFSIRSHSGRLP